MIDIGANIGDTALLVKNHTNIPILCIEGDERFYSLLQKNIEGFQDIYLESFVGDSNIIEGNYIYSKGTGRIAEQKGAAPMQFKSLNEILSGYPAFNKSKLLKIDTDGYDCRIIKNELKLLMDMRPILFFEYDPYYLKINNDDGLSVFDELFKINYKKMIIYENNGDYLLSTEVNQKQIIEDIHYFYCGRGGDKYYDICIFPSEDSELAEFIREKELNFFKNYRRF
jgi:FkbM family methyltransferase